jgi:hypothetical protein
MRRWCALALLFLAAFVVPSGLVWAQGMGASISGTVLDPSGAAVPDADLTLTALGTRAVAKVTSGADGGYSFLNLLTGPYDLEVSAKGFRPYVQKGILVNINAKVRVDVKLELGSAVETVEVSANASPLNFESPEQKGTIAPQTIDQLPLILAGHTRTAVAFARLLPGVTTGGGEDSLNFNTRVNGGINEGDEAVWDGVTIIDGSLGQNGIELAVTGHPMSPDAIQEVTLLTANYDAQFGSTSSSVLTAVTKSGTDSFHGTVYTLLRNNALNARQWGIANRPVNKETDFGGAIGGPVKIPWLFWSGRKKTYAFAHYEGFRLRGAPNAPRVTVPTMQQRQGDFSDWRDTDGNLIPIYDPATTAVDPITGEVSRQQFMGCDPVNNPQPNVICSTDPRLADSLAQEWLQYVPAPNLPGILNNYTPPNPPTGTVNADSTVFDLRVDHYVGERDHVAVTVHYFGSFGNNQTIFPKIIAAESFRSPNYNFANRLNWDHTFRPNLLNNLNIGYNDILSVIVCADEGTAAGVIPAIPGTRSNRLAPNIGIEGYRGFGCSSDGETTRPAYIVNDRLSWIKGKHTLGFGMEYRALQNKEISSGAESGNFSFSALNTGLRGETSGNGMASFLLGYMSGASMSLVTLADQHIRQKYIVVYGSDTWKVTPKFTFNYGVRWDISTPSKDKFDRVSFVDPYTPNPTAGGLPGVTRWAGNYAGNASLGRSYPEDIWYRGLAPRVGFAYSVTPKTVVRAGYGIFYQLLSYPSWTSGISPGRDGFNNTFSLVSPDGGLTPVGFLQDGLPPVPPEQEPPFFALDFNNGRYPGLYREFGKARTPYMQQWNFTIEKQFTDDFYISLAYVANKGTKIISQMVPLNAVDPQYLSFGDQLYDNFQVGDTSLHGVPIPYDGWIEQMNAGQCSPSLAQALSPYPQFCGTVANLGENAGNSNFQSFQFKAEKRFSRGFWFLTSYTWSKFISTYSDIQADAANWGGSSGIISPYQRERFKSLDNQDTPHSLSVAFVYELPLGRGKRYANQGGAVDKLLGGWQLTSIWRSQSGIPLFWYSSTCSIPGQFRAGCNPAVLPGQSPFAQDYGSFNPEQPLYNAAAFEGSVVDPVTGDVSNAMDYNYGAGGRTSNYRGFPFHNHNVSLQKTTSITERVKFQFRAEFFNIWNWHFFSRGTTWGEGGAFFNDLASPNFGLPTGSVTAPRNIQFGAKIIF